VRPDDVESALQRREATSVCLHVLVEAQLAAGTQHAADLREGGGRVRDGAEHERRHCGVEGRVRQWQLFGRAGDDPHRDWRGRRRVAGHGLQVRLGLDGHDLRDRRRVVREVRTGAGADLDDAALHACEQLPAVLGHAELLHLRRDARQLAREHGVPARHASYLGL
jgi:hypothetical protein